MRKLIASLLAGATVLSMASMASFATIAGSNATFKMNVGGTVANKKTYEVAVNVAGGQTVTKTTAATSAATAENLAGEIRKLKFDGWTLSGSGTEVIFTAADKADTKYTGVTATVKQTDDQSTNATMTLTGEITNGKADITVTTVTLAGGESGIKNEKNATVTLTPTIRDAQGDVTSKVDKSQITWDIKAPADGAEKAKIELKDGTVKILSPLEASVQEIKVTATCDGQTSKEAVIAVTPAAPAVKPVATVEVTEGPKQVAPGSNKHKYTAVAKDDTPAEIPGKGETATWTVEGAKDSTGTKFESDKTLTVSAKETDGSTLNVFATVDGKKSAAYAVTVKAVKDEVVKTVEVAGPNEVKPGQTDATYTATAKNQAGDELTEKSKTATWKVTGNTQQETKFTGNVLTVSDKEPENTALKVVATVDNVDSAEYNVTVKKDTPAQQDQKLVIKGMDQVAAGKTVTLTVAKEAIAPQTRAAETFTWTLAGAANPQTTYFNNKAGTTEATGESVQLTVAADQDVSALAVSVKSSDPKVQSADNVKVPGTPTPPPTPSLPNGTAATSLTIVDGDGKAIASGATVKPDSTVYALLDGVIGGIDSTDLVDKNYFKVDVKKATGSKFVKSVAVSEEKVAGKRQPVIKIGIKELMDDSDNKVVLEVSITPKSKAIDHYKDKGVTFAQDKFVMNDIKFYVSNTEHNGDQDYQAGTGGIVLKPTPNEDNEIVWSDENRDLARLTFEGDSDVKKIYPKLSTKWDSQYNDIVGNADAFLYNFVGNPSISSTSRATLEIYNPFYNSNDDKFYVPVEDIMVYEEIDGELVDITGKVTAGKNEDGDEVLTLRTRTLGKYIITDGTAIIDTGMEDESTVVEEEVKPSEKPANGGKPNPGTGF